MNVHLVRKNYGGLHLHFKVNPDIAIFGKALEAAAQQQLWKKNIMKHSRRLVVVLSGLKELDLRLHLKR